MKAELLQLELEQEILKQLKKSSIFLELNWF